jgi:predicted amidohydrolase YtcJ
MSTDMPFGADDPWAAMRAAVHRTTASGTVLGSAERIDARTALDMFLGEPGQPSKSRTVAPGQPANLCVIAASPEELLRELDADLVAATIVEGSVVFERD